MYLISTAVVSWNGVKSEQFKLCNGVKQGGVLSPLLFSIYINPLTQELNESTYSKSPPKSNLYISDIG